MSKEEATKKRSGIDFSPENISSQNETTMSLPENMKDKISFLSSVYATLSVFFSEESHQLIMPFTQLDIYNDTDDREIVFSKLIRYDNSLFISLDILRDLHKGAVRLNLLSKSGFTPEKEGIDYCLELLGEVEILTKNIRGELKEINDVISKKTN